MKQSIVNFIFHTGSFIMHFSNFVEKVFWTIMYPVYNFLMGVSLSLQDRWGLEDPWRKPDNGNRTS